MESAESLLRRYWNHESFREPQKQIIDDLLHGKDVFAILPTGSGKSLCYQLPTLMQDGICLVVSPLIALMQDQVESLRRKEIRALFLQSGKHQSEVVREFDNLRFGNYKFLYLSPEKLQSTWIQEKIRELPVGLIAIDEAHCISQWGHDFRPSYTKLAVLNEILPGVPKIALTATANQMVRDDIAKQLGLKDATFYHKSFERENLQLEIKRTPNVQESLQILLEQNKDPGIVYVGTRKDTIFYSKFLNQHGIKASFYHGGLSQQDKTRALERWISEDLPLMVATNAFGMGIDKPNVRSVIHCHLPQSPENYLQEIGRAGRDGESARAVLLFNDQMLRNAAEWRKKSLADPDFTMLVYGKLCDYYQVPIGECPEQAFDFALQSFCEVYNLPVVKCHAALGHLEQDDVLLVDQNAKKSSTVQIRIRGKSLYSMAQEKSISGKLLQALLRKYGGILEQTVSIGENSLGRHLNIPAGEIAKVLEDLDSQGVLYYSQRNNTGTIQFLLPREESYIRSQIKRSIDIRNRNKEKLARSMEAFVSNDKHCRIRQLGAYFGENTEKECGQCDVCRRRLRKEMSLKALQQKISNVLQEKGPCSIERLSHLLELDRDQIIKTVQMMREKDLLTVNLQNNIEFKA